MLLVNDAKVWKVAIFDENGEAILEWGGVSETAETASGKALAILQDSWRLFSAAYRKAESDVPSSLFTDVRVFDEGKPLWGLEHCRLREPFFWKLDPLEHVAQGRPIRQAVLKRYLELLLLIDCSSRAAWLDGSEPYIYARTSAYANPMRVFIQTLPGPGIMDVKAVFSEPVRDALRLLALHKCCAVRTNHMDTKANAKLEIPASATLRAARRASISRVDESEILPLVSYFHALGFTKLANGLKAQAKLVA